MGVDVKDLKKGQRWYCPIQGPLSGEWIIEHVGDDHVFVNKDTRVPARRVSFGSLLSLWEPRTPA